VIPAIYALIKGRGLPKAAATDPSSNQETLPYAS